MLHKVIQKELQDMLRREYPAWNEEYIVRVSEDHIRTLSEQLDRQLANYIATGEQLDVKAEGMTLYTILALHPGMRYFDAILLMDKYLKDPELGMARILRRRTR